MTTPPTPPPARPDPRVDVHGGRGRAWARARGLDPATVLDLSATLNPFAPDVAALVATHAGEVGAYPDATDATASLADALGVEPERVVLTNGGAEAIALVAAVLGAGDVVEPEFSLYRRHLPSVASGAPRWRSNPNNPLGLLAPADQRAAVWDEAFYGLTTGAWTRGDEDAWRVGSLTKLWACPGLRLGYALAPDPDGAAAVRARQPAWSVNAIGAALVPLLLEQTELAGWAKRLADQRAELVAVLRDAGWDPRPGDAPWVLVDEAASLEERLAAAGIVARDCASFGLPGTIRLAVPGDAGLDRVARALQTDEPGPPRSLERA